MCYNYGWFESLARKRADKPNEGYKKFFIWRFKP